MLAVVLGRSHQVCRDALMVTKLDQSFHCWWRKWRLCECSWSYWCTPGFHVQTTCAEVHLTGLKDKSSLNGWSRLKDISKVEVVLITYQVANVILIIHVYIYTCIRTCTCTYIGIMYIMHMFWLLLYYIYITLCTWWDMMQSWLETIRYGERVGSCEGNGDCYLYRDGQEDLGCMACNRRLQLWTFVQISSRSY